MMDSRLRESLLKKLADDELDAGGSDASTVAIEPTKTGGVSDLVRNYFANRLSQPPSPLQQFPAQRIRDDLSRGATNSANLALAYGGLDARLPMEPSAADAAQKEAASAGMANERSQASADDLAASLYGQDLRAQAAAADAARKAEQAKGFQESAAAGRGLKEKELADKNARFEFEQKRLKEQFDVKMKKGGQAKPAEAPDNVPFVGGKVYRATGGGSEKLRMEEGKQVRAKATDFAASYGAIEELKAALAEWAKAPSIDARARLNPAVLAAATSLNKALGQGAMSDSERRAAFGALGANVTDAQGLEALIQRVLGGGDSRAAETMVSRANAMQAVIHRQMDAAAHSLHFEPASAAPASPASPRRIAVNPKTGERRYINADGSLGEAVK